MAANGINSANAAHASHKQTNLATDIAAMVVSCGLAAVAVTDPVLFIKHNCHKLDATTLASGQYILVPSLLSGAPTSQLSIFLDNLKPSVF
jgi:hypothetical protein